MMYFDSGPCHLVGHADKLYLGHSLFCAIRPRSSSHHVSYIDDRLLNGIFTTVAGSSILDTCNKCQAFIGLFAGEEQHVELYYVDGAAVRCQVKATFAWVGDENTNERLGQHVLRFFVIDGKSDVVNTFFVDKGTIACKTMTNYIWKAVIPGLLRHMICSTTNYMYVRKHGHEDHF